MRNAQAQRTEQDQFDEACPNLVRLLILEEGVRVPLSEQVSGAILGAQQGNNQAGHALAPYGSERIN